MLLDISKDVQQTKERQDLLVKIQRILQDPANAKGLYVFGEYGTGKSHIMISTLNKLSKMGKTVAQINLADTISKLKQSMSEDKSNTIAEVNDMLRRADVLLIDDLGGEIVGN